jgi:hypothetical protein
MLLFVHQFDSIPMHTHTHHTHTHSSQVVIYAQFFIAALHFFTASYYECLFMLLTSILGYDVVRKREAFAMKAAQYYAVFCTVFVVYDSVMLGLGEGLNIYTRFEWEFFFLQFVAVGRPLTNTIAAALAYNLFSQLRVLFATNGAVAGDPGQPGGVGAAGGGQWMGGGQQPQQQQQQQAAGGMPAPATMGGGSSSSSTSSSSAPAATSAPSGFTPFSGQGNRLGGS